MLLLLNVLSQLQVVIKPISNQLPESVGHPLLVAIVLLIGLCFFIGALIRTAIGREAKRMVERNVFEHLPGYTMLRSVAEQISDTNNNSGFKPALVEIEEALVPGFIVETHEDGRCTVFIPSAPTPAAGSIYIIDSARVHPLDVPVTTMMKCITKWGSHSGELLVAMEKGK